MRQPPGSKAGTAPAASRGARCIGAVSGLYGDILQGWVLDPASPDLRVALEVYVDGAFVAMARADQFQHEFTEGDGFHGFAVQLRAAWLERARQVAVRVANQGPWLDGVLALPGQRPQATAPAASQAWYQGGLKVGGWAWDPHAPARHVEVTVREGSRVLARASADQLHPALVYRSTSDHGFSIDLPWALADGRPHELHIETDLGQPVSGSPLRMLTVPQGVQGLLHRHWSGPADYAALALLSRVAAEQDRLAPRTAGFSAYPEWFALFQQAATRTPAPMPLPRAGILVYGEAGAEAEQASRDSVQAQADGSTRIARADSGSLARSLRKLLAQDVEAIVLLHAGDRLAPGALGTLLPLVCGDEAAAWAYGDCDRDGPTGERGSPWFKPGWDIDLFLGADVFTTGAVYGAAIVREALALLEAADAPGLDVHGFTAAVAAATEAKRQRVARVPAIVYHRRHEAAASPADDAACPARLTAIQWLAQRLAPGATVDTHGRFPALLRVHWPLPRREALPTVSLIVPTRDQLALLRECVDGVLERTDYPAVELIVVDNDSAAPETLDYLAALPERGVKVLRYPHPFNYPAINNFAAGHASGQIVGLLNNDVAMRDAGWLKAMVAQVLRQDVGIVGAKLLWPNGMVQHGGVVVGINGLAAHTGNRWHADDAGYLGFNQVARRQSAVTAACLLLRKSLYDELGGLDARAFPVAFNDVDLCLRVRERGLAVVWTPLAELTHKESASRGKDVLNEQAARATREQQQLMARWPLPHGDPCYHPHLNADWATGPYGGLNLAAR